METVFKTWNKKLDKYASSKLRGQQLMFQLPYIDPDETSKLKNQKIVWIKPLVDDYDDILILLGNENIVYLDILDDFLNLQKLIGEFADFGNNLRIFWPNYLSANIFSSQLKTEKQYVLYHQSDTDLIVPKFNNLTIPKVVYYGSPHKMEPTNEKIDKIYPEKNNLYLDLLSNYNIHYLCRKEQYQFDPITKLSVASEINNTIVVCSKFDAYAEILGEEYPFYIEKVGSLKNVKKQFNTPMWFQTVNLIKEKTEILRFKNVFKKFNEIIYREEEIDNGSWFPPTDHI